VLAGLNASGPHFNKVDGDPSYNLYTSMINAGYDLGSVQLYGFASYGQRKAQHYENYRGAQKAAPSHHPRKKLGVPAPSLGSVVVPSFGTATVYGLSPVGAIAKTTIVGWIVVARLL
jgi:hypothetical protein